MKKSSTTSAEKRDIFAETTASIIAAIEQGAGEYQMPWHRSGSAICSPLNIVTRKPYRGMNVFLLWAMADHKKYPAGQWATYKQWSELGAQVRKGEKSTHIVFWGSCDSRTKFKPDGTPQKILFPRYYSVFNVAQVDGYKALEVEPLSDAERIADAEEFFSKLSLPLEHRGDSAHYSPSADTITMPAFEQFKSGLGYYSVLAHEAIHYTASRIDRKLGDRFGSSSYAIEELIAELGSAMLCAHLCLANEPRPENAQYIASWLKVLHGDKKAIFTAAREAQKAVDYLLRKAGLDTESDSEIDAEPSLITEEQVEA